MEDFFIQLRAISPVDWFAMATGILGVYLSIKEKVFAWPLFISCYVAYVYISFRGNYYAFGGLNIAFVAVASYGWYKWAKPKVKSGDRDVHISHIHAKHRWMVAAFIVLGTMGIGWLLASFDQARLPYYDAFATTCALTAQWMLSRKHIENWLFWILSDIVYLIFFFNDQIWPSVILFTAFIGLAIKGWLEWKAIINKTEQV